MKKSHIVFTLLVFSLIMLVSGPASATIAGSVHDFSTGGTSGFQATNEDEVCIFCHTPHGGLANDPAGTTVKLPLWNRNLNYGGSFTMYDSQTFNGDTTYISGKPTGMSLLCLSCHDGVSTINGIINYSSDANPIIMSGIPPNDQIGDLSYPTSRDPNIGSDLSNDHPVSFIYNDALATTDGGLHMPETVTAPGTPAEPLVLFGNLNNRRLECPTCHDAHEYGEPDKIPFLRMNNAGSGMCLKCHNK